MTTPSIGPDERQSRIERSRVLLVLAVVLLVLGIACLFFVGAKTGLAIIVLSAIVFVAWTVIPYTRDLDLSATRIHANMSDPKGGVEESATEPVDPQEPERGPGRVRRMLRRLRSRGSGPD